MPLGDLLRRSREAVALDPLTSYKQITVRLHHRGAVLRGSKLGSEIGSSRQYRARTGQLIVSGIDARNGAISVVPPELDGAIVTNDFWLFDIDHTLILPQFLDHYVGTRRFSELCGQASEGTTNRVRLQPEQFLALPIPLPSRAEQEAFVAKIETLTRRTEEIRRLRHETQTDLKNLLMAMFQSLIIDAPITRFGSIAPLVRRPVEVDPQEDYPELGVRSFGKGTFHKPSVKGYDLGNKRVFYIQPGDLVFSNVFAWEGAVAIASASDIGRIGSHRFITCVPDPELVIPEYLEFFFLTPQGLELLGNASPGGAGRNRTLGLKALSDIPVPIPSLDEQEKFRKISARVKAISNVCSKSDQELSTLLLSVIDRTFQNDR